MQLEYPQNGLVWNKAGFVTLKPYKVSTAALSTFLTVAGKGYRELFLAWRLAFSYLCQMRLPTSALAQSCSNMLSSCSKVLLETINSAWRGWLVCDRV